MLCDCRRTDKDQWHDLFSFRIPVNQNASCSSAVTLKVLFLETGSFSLGFCVEFNDIFCAHIRISSPEFESRKNNLRQLRIFIQNNRRVREQYFQSRRSIQFQIVKSQRLNLFFQHYSCTQFTEIVICTFFLVISKNCVRYSYLLLNPILYISPINVFCALCVGILCFNRSTLPF